MHLADITNHLVNTLFSLADDSAVVDTVTAAADTASDVVSSAASAAADTVTAATAATDAVTTVATDAATADAAATAAKNAGWFGFLADAFENILRVGYCSFRSLRSGNFTASEPELTFLIAACIVPNGNALNILITCWNELHLRYATFHGINGLCLGTEKLTMLFFGMYSGHR